MKRVYIATCTDDVSGRVLDSKAYWSEAWASRFAHRCYDKFGENQTVEVGYFDDEHNFITTCTWHA